MARGADTGGSVEMPIDGTLDLHTFDPREVKGLVADYVGLCRERGILIPTFAQMREPATIHPAVRARLPEIDMQALDPLNLFRITWRNDPESGGFGDVIELRATGRKRSAITGVVTGPRRSSDLPGR